MSVRIPSYRLHKPSSLAVVTIDGRDFYLGTYGSVESRESYGRMIANHAAGISATAKASRDDSGLSVNEVVLAFLRHAKKHYARDGEPTDEYPHPRARTPVRASRHRIFFAAV